MAWIWIVIIAALILLFAGDGRKKTGKRQGKPYRVDRMHLIGDDDYECSVCHRRFLKNVMVCPYCGARFEKREQDDEEFIFEEDEMEAWDEEDGW